MDMTREEYDEFVDASPQGTIFHKSWWLDATCPGEWDFVTVRKGTKPQAIVTFRKVRRWGGDRILPAQLTNFSGVLLSPAEGKSVSVHDRDMEKVSELLELLPPCDQILLQTHYSFTNWLPFYWRGFSCSPQYSYVLDFADKSIEMIWEDFKKNIRTEIRKAEKQQLSVRTDLGISKFIETVNKSFVRQHLPFPYDVELLTRVDAACEQHGVRNIYFAVDAQERVHAAIYLVWDKNSAYYIMGGGDPELRNSGAHAMLMWRAMNDVYGSVKTFDFSGSMTKQIEAFVSAFGTSQRQYFSISKTTRRFRMIQLLSKIRQGISFGRLQRS